MQTPKTASWWIFDPVDLAFKHVLACLVVTMLVGLTPRWSTATEPTPPLSRSYTIPMVDLNQQANHFVTVAREPGQYLGHPSTVLFADGRTMLAAFPTAHGKGDLRLRRSQDAGRTWEDVPAHGIKLHEVPILYLLKMPDGGERVLLTTCEVSKGVLLWTWSDDQGQQWAQMRRQPLEGVRGILVALASLWDVRGTADKHGRWRGVFHDYNYDNYTVDVVLRPDSADPRGWACDIEGLTRIDYATPAGKASAHHAGLCEGGVIRSLDGHQLAMLLRPQHKRTNAMIVFSQDEGVTWTDPVELPGALTGERHVAQFSPDGRLLVCFRDYSPLNPGNPSHGDWVAWVGTWDDLVRGREGSYRIRLKRNYGNSTNANIGDCGYTGVHVLPDGTFVCTTYGHWELAPGSSHPNHPDGRGQPPSIISARFKLSEIDGLLDRKELRLN